MNKSHSIVPQATRIGPLIWAITLQLLTIPAWYWLLGGKSALNYVLHNGWFGLTASFVRVALSSLLVVTCGVWLSYWATRSMTKHAAIKIALMTLLLPVFCTLTAIMAIVIAVVIFDMPIISKG